MTDILQHKEMGQVTNIASIFAALGDDRRLMILSKLGDETDQSISQLKKNFSLTRQGVSRHLHVLEKAGLVGSYHQGRETRYCLKIEELDRAKNYLLRASLQWDDAIGRLAKHVED